MTTFITCYLVVCVVVIIWLYADHLHYENKKPELEQDEIEFRIKRAYDNADNTDRRDQREYFLDVAGYWEHELEKLNR